MNKIQAHINELLDRFDDIHVLDEPERGMGFHIFFDLRNHYHKQLAQAENLQLFYHYKLFEKCLSLMRKRELHASETVYREIEASGLNYPAFLSDGMVSLYYAMAAYREYAFGRYDNAIAKLRKAIRHAEQQGEDYPLFLCEIAEQWLNVVRVHIRVGNEDAIVNETVEILAFLLTGLYQEKAVGTRYLALPQKDHNQALIHVINSVYMGLERMARGDGATIDRIFSRICSGLEPHLHGASVNAFMSDSVRLLDQYYRGDSEGFVASMLRQFAAVQNTTRALQKLLFTAFLNVCGEQDFPVEHHRNFALFNELMHDLFKIGPKKTKAENELPALSATGV